MNYIYKSRSEDYAFTDAMKEAVEKHFAKLSKYLSNEPIKITLDKEGNDFIAKLQVVSKENKRLRAEEVGDNFYDLITKLRDSIERQLHKAKTKLTWKERLSKKQEVIEEVPNPVVKVKELTLDSITTQMAINEMEKLGHDWFCYKDLEDDCTKIIYKRFEDNYGVIKLV